MSANKNWKEIEQRVPEIVEMKDDSIPKNVNKEDVKNISVSTGIDEKLIRTYRDNKKVRMHRAFKKFMTSLSELSNDQNMKKSRDQKSGFKISRDQKLETANNLRSRRSYDQTNRKSKQSSMSKYKHVKSQKYKKFSFTLCIANVCMCRSC